VVEPLLERSIGLNRVSYRGIEWEWHYRQVPATGHIRQHQYGRRETRPFRVGKGRHGLAVEMGGVGRRR